LRSVLLAGNESASPLDSGKSQIALSFSAGVKLMATFVVEKDKPLATPAP
jgi:hypothetical protein